MADAPWRCSQCGTVNEPNANACRSCGRWPSLFDLERGTLDVDVESPDQVDEEEVFTRHEAPPVAPRPPVEVAPPVEQERDRSGAPDKPAEWPGPEDPLDRPMQGWPRLASWIVPILVVLYIAISAIVDR